MCLKTCINKNKHLAISKLNVFNIKSKSDPKNIRNRYEKLYVYFLIESPYIVLKQPILYTCTVLLI